MEEYFTREGNLHEGGAGFSENYLKRSEIRF